MGGLREERFGGSGRRLDNEGKGWGSGNGWRRRQWNGISNEEDGETKIDFCDKDAKMLFGLGFGSRSALTQL